MTRHLHPAITPTTTALVGCLSLAPALAAQSLALPPRPADALPGRAIIEAVEHLPRPEREERLLAEYLGGNVPSWLRTLVPVTMQRPFGERTVTVTFHATPDYLAVGSDDDWLLTPLSPGVAQRIADVTGTSLPTPVMVDAIWRAATATLGPDSIAPSAAMITVPVFADHHRMVRARRDADPAPLGALTAGHKKDVVIAARLDSLPDRVAIYGWHRPDGRPIQPLYTGHGANYADYSHGIRLVDRRILIDGAPHDLIDVLRDSVLAQTVTAGGPMRLARYPIIHHAEAEGRTRP